MTISELIKKYGDKIKNINTQLDGNHNITFNDINNEIICKKYNSNSLNVFSNYGLLYENNEAKFLYNKIDRIEISADKLNIDCKGECVKIECFAIINVYDNDKIYKVIRHKINPLYSFEGCEFNFINNLAIIKENHEFNRKIIKIHAKYGYNGILYKSSLDIVQSFNYESDWIEGDEDIIDIVAECDKNVVSNLGEEVEIKIYKKSALNLYKKDCFNNITSTKKTSEVITDITNESILLVNKPFKLVNSNKVIFPSQEVNSPVRVATVIYKYKSFERQIEIYQNKGPVVSYENKFKFEDGDYNKVIKLDNCLGDKFEIKLLSYKIRFLDGIEYDKIYDNDIIINNDTEWVSCDINNENMSLECTILKNDTNNIRQGIITLINKDKKLYLQISQPPRLMVKCEYCIQVICEDELLVNKLINNFIIFKPIKKIYYDDNTFETIQYLDPFHKLDVIYNISDENSLSITKPKMIDFNGVHESKIDVKDYNNYNDIFINVKCRILDNNLNQISEIQNKDIIIHFLKPKVKDIEINITITNTNNEINVASKNQPTFKIIDSKDNIIYESIISRFWVNQFMKNDLVHNCNVKLIENETYNFNIGKYYYLDKSTKELSENYLIENDDIGIDLNMDI